MFVKKTATAVSLSGMPVERPKIALFWGGFKRIESSELNMHHRFRIGIVVDFKHLFFRLKNPFLYLFASILTTKPLLFLYIIIVSCLNPLNKS